MALAYFPLYPTDFDADTGHLSFAEDGAYNRLLRLSWRCPDAKMPADEEWVFRKVRAVSSEEKALVRSILSEFFTRKGGKFFSKRLAEEWAKANASHAKRISAGSEGGRAKAMKTNGIEPSNALALTYQPEPEPEPEKKEDISRLSDAEMKPAETPARASTEGFAEFWEIYPHRGRKQGRKPSQAKFDRVVKSGVPSQQLIDAARRYRADKRVRDGFARDPLTWLNQAGWEDEATDSPSTPGRREEWGRFSA